MILKDELGLRCLDMQVQCIDGIAELREEMLVLEKYWQRGIELYAGGVLDRDEFCEWGAVCMSAMVVIAIDGMQRLIKNNKFEMKALAKGHFLLLPAEVEAPCWEWIKKHQEVSDE